jgi:hypothetical protein
MVRTPLAAPAALVAALVMVSLAATVPTAEVDAATITASYAAGHDDVVINGYGTPGLGAFTLHDGGVDLVAFCIQADAAHSRATDAYRPVDGAVGSAELDYLLWAYARGTLGTDDDTATAVAALAWFHAGADRRSGVPVWADGASGFAPISPTSPSSWDALPRFSMSFPVGLRGGGRDLDAAERRVHELFVRAQAHRGPWELSEPRIDGDDVVVDVTGPGGPIDGADVRFETRPRSGGTPTSVVVRSSPSGRATLAGGRVPGSTIGVEVESPGPHREWDGDGDVQRLATPTSVALGRSIAVPPDRVHVRIVKRSTDPTISVAGGSFELVDATGRVVRAVTSPSTGVIDVGPLDPAEHPLPYAVREAVAPPGLRASADPIELPLPLSTDPRHPTSVEILNEPVPRPIAIRKVLDQPDVGPTDRSGFGFSVRRLADDRDLGVLVTGADGRTPPLDVTIGRIEVCETRVPDWASGLVDGGCRVVEIVPGDDTTTVDYVNLVPLPSLTTSVHDPVDGDRDVAIGGGRLVDVVTYRDVVPGTEYTVEGVIHVLGPDGSVEATALTGSTTFVAELPSGSVEVVFDIPSGATDGVVFETMSVAGRVVAVHDDPSDPAQTFRVVAEPPVPSTVAAAPPIDPPAAPATTSVPATTTSARVLPDAGGRADTLLDAAVIATTAGMVLLALGLGARRR